MGRRRKLYDRITSGSADSNIPFAQIRNMLINLSFEERVSGSHHVFTKEGIEEMINLQEIAGG